MSRLTPCTFMGDRFDIAPGFRKAAAETYGMGEVVNLEAVEERSGATHRHFFVSVNEAWKNLPEHLAMEYPSPSHLRKRALIRCGYCTVADYVCGSKAEAMRWATNLRKEGDEYALVVVSEAVVRVYRPKSQSVKAMGAAEFAASKDAVLAEIAGLIDVTPAALGKAAAA